MPAGAGPVTDSDKFGSCRSPVHGDPSVENVDLNREFDRVFGDYRRVRLRSGLPTYLGRLTLLYGSAPRADHQDQPVLGVVGDVVPVIPAVIIGRAGRVAVNLLLAHEGPLLIELDLAGTRGEKATNSSWVAWA